jgi:hypothetical protein
VVCGATTGAMASKCDISVFVDWGGETKGEINFAGLDGSGSGEIGDKKELTADGGDMENFENNDMEGGVVDNTVISSIDSVESA